MGKAIRQSPQTTKMNMQKTCQLSKKARAWAGDNKPLWLPSNKLKLSNWRQTMIESIKKVDESRVLAKKGNCSTYVNTQDHDYHQIRMDMTRLGWTFEVVFHVEQGKTND